MQRELVLLVDRNIVDALSDALIDAGALSVSVEDADADGETETPLYGEPGHAPAQSAWRRNRLTLMVDGNADAARLLAAAATAIGQPVPEAVAARDVDDVDWVRLTQAQFQPTRISERLWVVPTWHQPPDPAAINIRLDPGVAFGTGTHPTTRLCLRWLAQADLADARVLDYGCGSGILAIAAAKLGARDVVGTDIDVQALAAARANSAINHAEVRYTEPQQVGDGVYDVILANILASPLKILAPTLIAQLAPAGRIVLSGILDRQAEDVIETYAALCDDIALGVWDRDEGWSCVVGARPGRG